MRDNSCTDGQTITAEKLLTKMFIRPPNRKTAASEFLYVCLISVCVIFRADGAVFFTIKWCYCSWQASNTKIITCRTVTKTECAVLLEWNIVNEEEFPLWRFAEVRNVDRGNQWLYMKEGTQDAIIQTTESINTGKETCSMGYCYWCYWLAVAYLAALFQLPAFPTRKLEPWRWDRYVVPKRR